jgi:hypothetical protein
MRSLDTFDMSEPALPLKIQVETEVQVWEDTTNSHDLPSTTISTVTSPPHPQSTSPHFLPISSSRTLMSLPRASYDPRRVCLNPFPEFTLGKHRRAIGAYLAGALVCCGIVLGSMLNVVWIVYVGELDFFGRCDPVCSCKISLGRPTRRPAARPRHIRRLDSGNLLFARISRYQFD